MMTENSALELARSWYRAATSPGTELQVSVMSSSGDGWLARAVANPRPTQPLPMLRISPQGAVTILGGQYNTMLR
jgi:hypothetical protein